MKILRNRTVLGIMCIAISLFICFAITPLVNRGLSSKTTIVRMKKNAGAGSMVTAGMIEEVEVGKYNLPENVIRSAAEVEGMYLTADLYCGDYILTEKVSATQSEENEYLYHLNGEKQAMSVTINTFAEGVSGKLKSGDIVSVIVNDYEGTGESVIPIELKYMEVIAVTAKSGNDANTETQPVNEEEEDEKELPSTVTMLVTPEQSAILAHLEAETEMHLALVFRGDAKEAKKFIDAQDLVLKELIEAAKEAKAGENPDADGGVAYTDQNNSDAGEPSANMASASE